jgi:hypothetical protein
VANSDQFKRQLLSRYADVAPPEWRFSPGEHGKPALLDPVVGYRLAICWLSPAAVQPRLRMFELRGAGQPATEFSQYLRAASVSR